MNQEIRNRIRNELDIKEDEVLIGHVGRLSATSLIRSIHCNIPLERYCPWNITLEPNSEISLSYAPPSVLTKRELKRLLVRIRPQKGCSEQKKTF